MGTSISVIIVTWNATDHVDRCLSALAADVGERSDVEVIVVDNDSTDGTADHVRDSWPSVLVVEAGSNGGMAAGNNVGIAHATGRVLVLLNSDAFVHAGALAALEARLDAEPTVGVVVPRLEHPDGALQRSIRGFPTTWRYATEFWFLRRIAPRSRALNAFYGAGDPHDAVRDVEWATGAVLGARRSAVEDVGVMDERFFMYGEEVEWLHRMRAAGWRTVFDPAARVTHLAGGSTGGTSAPLFAIQCRNHVRYRALVDGRGAARRTRFVVVTGLLLRVVAHGAIGALTRSPRHRARSHRSRAGARAAWSEPTSSGE